MFSIFQASLIDQDLALMRQLLTLNEQIEELKWQRKYSTSNTSYSSELSKDSSIDASGTYLDSSAYTLSSSHAGEGLRYDPGSRDDMLQQKYPSPSMLSILSGCDQSQSSLMGSQDWNRPGSDSKTIEEQGDSTSDLGSSTELTSSSNSIKRSKSSAGNSDTLNSTLTNSSQEEDVGDTVPDYETKIHNHEPLMYELQEYQILHQKPPAQPRFSPSPSSHHDTDYMLGFSEYEDRFDIHEHLHDTKVEVRELLNNVSAESVDQGSRGQDSDAISGQRSDDVALDSTIPHPEEGYDISCSQALKAFDMVLEDDDTDAYTDYCKSDVINNNNSADNEYDLEICIPPPGTAETDDELEQPYHEVEEQA